MQKKQESEPSPEEVSTESLLSLVDVSPPLPRTELVLGHLVSMPSANGYGVVFAGSASPIPCLSTIPLDETCLNRQVALMFLEGSPAKPVVLGLIHDPKLLQNPPLEARVDEERVQLVGQKEIELRCGKASILMKANGKIIIKGTHLISRSSGPNKIKGGSISLN